MRTVMSVGLAGLVLVMAACNDAKSPGEVAKDVTSAQQQAASAVDRSEDRAARDLDKAAAKVDDTVVAFNDDATRDAYNVALTKALGDRKVALAKCMALEGDAQKACKDQADADYDTARAKAKSVAQAPKQ